MNSITKKKRNQRNKRKIINGMLRCTCGCENHFPATTEYFTPKHDCICGFEGVSKQCRNLKNRRKAAEMKSKQPHNDMKGELCSYYDDYVYC